MTDSSLRAFYTWFGEERKRRLRMTLLLSSFCQKLVSLGVPLDRVTLHVPQLDPQLRARSMTWDREAGGAMEIGRAHGIENASIFIVSPIRPILEGETDHIWRRLGDDQGPSEFPLLDELAGRGYTEYHSFALDFSTGQHNAMTMATRHPAGFSDAERGTIRQGLPLFGALLELRHTLRTAGHLLDTYIGHVTGERVLDGDVKRGEGEIIHAVIWTCDLRGFTELSENEPLEEVITLLDDYFEAAGRPVENRGGEILKFIGDAVLAIFPLKAGADPGPTCAAALEAAEEAVAALRTVSAKREAVGKSPIACGFALHLGDVMFGNIGTADRLDFTVIGPAVNLVSRMEGLTRELVPPIAFSPAFGARLERATRSLGRFNLKGIARAQEVLTLTEE